MRVCVCVCQCAYTVENFDMLIFFLFFYFQFQLVYTVSSIMFIVPAMGDSYVSDFMFLTNRIGIFFFFLSFFFG